MESDNNQSNGMKKIIIFILAMFFLIRGAINYNLKNNPFSSFANWLLKQDMYVHKIIGYQDEYRYNNYIASDNYLDFEGQTYSDETFKDTEMEVAYYSQLDNRWRNEVYGEGDRIGGFGCGPTSLSMVISSLTENRIDPVQMSKWSYDNGYFCKSKGSYHELIPECARYFNLKVECIGKDEPDRLTDSLREGKLVVALLGKGHFASSGHFIVLRGITPDDKILVADPLSRERSEKEWDKNIIVDESKGESGAGGPFWAISKYF